MLTPTSRRRNLFSSWLISLAVLYALPAVSGPAFAAGLTRDGRLLKWNGRPVQLVGCSYYGLVADRRFDAEAFLDTLAAHNVNFTRFFVILPWPVEGGPNLLPFVETDGQYDLRNFDNEFFEHLRKIVAHADNLGIVCQVCLFDRCGLSVSDRRAWENNPYNFERNVNGLLKGPQRGYPPFCQTSGRISEVNAALIQRVVHTLGDRGNVIYEIMNEPYPQLGPLPEWHSWVARQLRENLANQPGSNVIASTGPYEDADIDLFSMHMASDDRSVASALLKSKELNKPVIFSDDGDMRCMFQPRVTRAALARALKLGQHFEHLAYTITLQREHDKRPAARLDQMPALTRINLRTLSERSTPLRAGPYVRSASLEKTAAGEVLSARIEQTGKLRRVVGEWSTDGGRTWSPVKVSTKENRAQTEPLNARKGTPNLVRVVCMDDNSRRWPGPAYLLTPSEWSIELGETVAESGLLRVRPHRPDGAVHQVRRGDRMCYETDLSRRGKYAYFRFEPSFPRQEAGAFTMVVEYFDRAAGPELLLEYDGKSGPYAAAEPIELGGSKTWKTASFAVPNALFQGRQNDAADFRLSLRGKNTGALALRSVRAIRSNQAVSPAGSRPHRAVP